MKTKMNHPNEAVRLLRLKHFGPRPLARAIGVSSSTAAGWLDGKKPAPEHRAAIADTLDVAVDDWDRAPIKKLRNSSKTSAQVPASISINLIDKSALESGANADDVFAELARLRGHRRQAEAEDRLPAVLALAATELRVLRRLALANGETSVRGQLCNHPTVRRVAAVLLSVEDPDTAGRLCVVLAEHRIVPATDEVATDDDPVLEPAPDAAAHGLRCLLRRTARCRARAEAVSEATIAAKWLTFEARARDVAARVAGHEPALTASPEWAALKMRLLECFKSADLLRTTLDHLTHAIATPANVEGLCAR